MLHQTHLADRRRVVGRRIQGHQGDLVPRTAEFHGAQLRHNTPGGGNAEQREQQEGPVCGRHDVGAAVGVMMNSLGGWQKKNTTERKRKICEIRQKREWERKRQGKLTQKRKITQAARNGTQTGAWLLQSDTTCRLQETARAPRAPPPQGICCQLCQVRHLQKPKFRANQPKKISDGRCLESVTCALPAGGSGYPCTKLGSQVAMACVADT